MADERNLHEPICHELSITGTSLFFRSVDRVNLDESWPEPRTYTSQTRAVLQIGSGLSEAVLAGTKRLTPSFGRCCEGGPLHPEITPTLDISRTEKKGPMRWDGLTLTGPEREARGAKWEATGLKRYLKWRYRGRTVVRA